MNPLKFLCRSQEFRRRLEQGRPRLYRIAYAWTHDQALADDLVQETMERALKGGAQLRDIDTMPVWLSTILTNCWRDHLRRRRPMEGIDDLDIESDSNPQADQERSELQHKVRSAVAGLPAPQRQVLTLVDLGEHSYAEVAQLLGIPIGTVMSRISRARAALAVVLMDIAALEQTPVSLRRVK